MQKPQHCSDRDVSDTFASPTRTNRALAIGTGSSVTNVTAGPELIRSDLRALVALTPTEAAELLELARGRAADEHSAAVLLGQLAALVDRARLHDTRQDTNR
jgi:hypothetical protein